MPAGAALAVGTIAAGAMSASSTANAADKASRVAGNAQVQAAQIQADAANRATQLQSDIYTDQRGLLAPVGGLGAGAAARQARMAGLSTGEIQNFYNGTMASLNAPFTTAAATPGDTSAQPTYGQPNGMGAFTADGAGALSPTYVGAPGGTTPNGTGAVNYAERDLGNLDDFAPQTFQFGADELYADPSYQFRLDQGQKALERSAAARGRLVSGATAQNLQEHAQDFASTEFDTAFTRAFNQFQIEDTNRWNRLGALSGAGANATANIITAGNNFADGASQTIQNAGAATAAGIRGEGAARASGYAAQGQAWGDFWKDSVGGALGFGAGQGWFGGGNRNATNNATNNTWAFS